MTSTSIRTSSMRIAQPQQPPSQHDENAMPSSFCSSQVAATASTFGSMGRTRSPSKLPTLSDIAARLNRDKESINPNSGSPIKPHRLELTGRIANSPKMPQLYDRKAAVLSTSPSKMSSPADTQHKHEKATVCSSPPKVPSSGTSSPNKRMLAKGLPSLEEIRDRMSKKGLAAGSDQTSPELASTPSSPSKVPAAEDRSVQSESKPSPVQALVAHPFKVESNPTTSDASKSASRVAARSLSIAPTVKLTHPLPPSPAAKPACHPLQHEWTLFFDCRTAGAPSTPTFAPNCRPLSLPHTPTQAASTWEANLRTIGTYPSVETFLSCFAQLRRPSQLERHSTYHCFKDGIKPMWEDTRNAQGGKWTLTFRHRHPALVDRSWLWLVLGLIGEDMDEADETCGAVCSARPRGDRISLWVRDRSDVEKVNRIGRKMISLLGVENEPGISLEFSAHSERSDELKCERLYSLHNPMQMARTPTMSTFGDSAKLASSAVDSPPSPRAKTRTSTSPTPNNSSSSEPYARLTGQTPQNTVGGGMFRSRSPAMPSCSTAGLPTPPPTGAIGALGHSLGLGLGLGLGGNNTPAANTNDAKAGMSPLSQQSSETSAFSWRTNTANRTLSPQRKKGTTDGMRSRSTSPFKA